MASSEVLATFYTLKHHAENLIKEIKWCKFLTFQETEPPFFFFFFYYDFSFFIYGEEETFYILRLKQTGLCKVDTCWPE